MVAHDPEHYGRHRGDGRPGLFRRTGPSCTEPSRRTTGPMATTEELP